MQRKRAAISRLPIFGCRELASRQLIDGEVQRIVTEQYARAYACLQAHRAALESLTAQLLQQETVDGSAVEQVLAGEAQLAAQNGQIPIAALHNAATDGTVQGK